MRVYIRRLESSDVGIESNRLSHSYCIRAVDSSFSDSRYHAARGWAERPRRVRMVGERVPLGCSVRVRAGADGAGAGAAGRTKGGANRGLGVRERGGDVGGSEEGGQRGGRAGGRGGRQREYGE